MLGTATAIGTILNDDTAAVTSGILISQFRLSGPNGNSDQFIELYNGTGAAQNL